MDMAIGSTRFVRDFSNRRILVTDRCILHVPVITDMVNGMVVAYDSVDGHMMWRANYVDNQPIGVCEVCVDRVMESVAVKCAEYVLD